MDNKKSNYNGLPHIIELVDMKKKSTKNGIDRLLVISKFNTDGNSSESIQEIKNIVNKNSPDIIIVCTQDVKKQIIDLSHYQHVLSIFLKQKNYIYFKNESKFDMHMRTRVYYKKDKVNIVNSKSTNTINTIKIIAKNREQGTLYGMKNFELDENEYKGALKIKFRIKIGNKEYKIVVVNDALSGTNNNKKNKIIELIDKFELMKDKNDGYNIIFCGNFLELQNNITQNNIKKYENEQKLKKFKQYEYSYLYPILKGLILNDIGLLNMYINKSSLQQNNTIDYLKENNINILINKYKKSGLKNKLNNSNEEFLKYFIILSLTNKKLIDYGGDIRLKEIYEMIYSEINNTNKIYEVIAKKMINNKKNDAKKEEDVLDFLKNFKNFMVNNKVNNNKVNTKILFLKGNDTKDGKNGILQVIQSPKNQYETPTCFIPEKVCIIPFEFI